MIFTFEQVAWLVAWTCLFLCFQLMTSGYREKHLGQAGELLYGIFFLVSGAKMVGEVFLTGFVGGVCGLAIICLLGLLFE